MLKISDSAFISPLAYVEHSKRGSAIEIGNDVFIDAFVRIRAVGGDGSLIIGDNTDINSGCVIFTGNGITIGRNVLIGPNCTLVPTNHAYHARDKLIRDQRFLPSKGGIIIEDDVWIGSNCCILDGAILRRGCVIGASSLVRTEVEAASVNAGNPLRMIGMRNEQ
jgi:virginiamycin A acetyltransferase